MLERLRARLRALLAPAATERELGEEMRAHLDRDVERHVAAGMSRDDATAAARRAFGNVPDLQEQARDAIGTRLIPDLAADVRYAARVLRRSPGFTSVAVLSLALGIGANTAIFGLIDAVLLRPLPVSRPEQLVTLTSYAKAEKVGDFGYPEYLALRDGSRALSGLLAASRIGPVEVGLGAEVEVAARKVVSANYFAVLGVNPALGLPFTNAGERAQVAVVSDGFWRRSLGTSPSAVGRQVTLDGVPFTVIGVAPAGFFGETVGEAPDIWALPSLMPADRRDQPGFTWLNLMGRLNPGADARQVAADLDLVLSRSASAGGESGRHVAVEPGARGLSGLRDRFSGPLKVLMAVVAVVLLITCTNLAGLVLARSAARQREVATRLAIGAGGGRLVRQFVTESLLLALLGGALGVLFAAWSQRLLLALLAGGGRVITLDLSPDLRILLFAVATSIATGLLFGLAPALHAVRRGVGTALKTGARSLAGRGRRWGLKDLLIATQVALSLLLLVVGGLFIRTLSNLRGQDVGLRAENVLSVEVGVERGYRPDWRAVSLALLQRTRAIPGVQSATVALVGTLSDNGAGVTGLKVEGYDPPGADDQRARANWVGPAYFATTGIPLLEGRDLSEADVAAAPKVAVVNRAFARHFFGDGRAVGRRFEFNKQQYEVAGVAADAKYSDLRAAPPRIVYFAVLQGNGPVHSLEMRTAGPPLAVAGPVREAVREVDPRLRIGEVTTLPRRIDQKLGREFLVADIAGFFGRLSVLLVCIGTYGTLACTVARRTNEIGIRMALGARPASVLAMVLRDITAVLAVGIAAGVAAVLAAGRLVASLLYGLEPTDLTTIVLAALPLFVTALAAGYVPARRASRVDPLRALRMD